MFLEYSEGGKKNTMDLSLIRFLSPSSVCIMTTMNASLSGCPPKKTDLLLLLLLLAKQQQQQQPVSSSSSSLVPPNTLLTSDDFEANFDQKRKKSFGCLLFYETLNIPKKKRKKNTRDFLWHFERKRTVERRFITCGLLRL